MKLWQFIVAATLVILGLVLLLTDMARGDEIISRPRAQVLSAELKNDGLCREFILGEAMTMRPEKAAGCHGRLFSIEGSESGFFSIWVHQKRLYLERLAPPQGTYQKYLSLISAADYFPLLYCNNGAKAVEVGKKFASAVFREGSEPEYSADEWQLIAGPNLIANRANLTLMSVDGMVRIKLSLIALPRNGKCELEVCEADVKRKPPPAIPGPNPPASSRVVCKEVD